MLDELEMTVAWNAELRQGVDLTRRGYTILLDEDRAGSGGRGSLRRVSICVVGLCGCLRQVVVVVNGSGKRSPDFFETSVWSGRSIDVKGEHRVVVAFPSLSDAVSLGEVV